VAQIRDAGGQAIGVDCNVGDATQVARLVARSTEHFGRLDCVVNNAATALRVGVRTLTTRCGTRQWTQRVGPIRLIHECIPLYGNPTRRPSSTCCR